MVQGLALAAVLAAAAAGVPEAAAEPRALLGHGAPWAARPQSRSRTARARHLQTRVTLFARAQPHASPPSRPKLAIPRARRLAAVHRCSGCAVNRARAPRASRVFRSNSCASTRAFPASRARSESGSRSTRRSACDANRPSLAFYGPEFAWAARVGMLCSGAPPHRKIVST
eukprot:3319475-Prymnesium_polylepis.1